MSFTLSKNTQEKLLHFKDQIGFKDESWNDFFEYLLNSIEVDEERSNELEQIMKKIFDEKFYGKWVENFGLNLCNIWNESSARELDPTVNGMSKSNVSSIVIGRGPSIAKHNHLERLANSDYDGTIVCCDGALINALKAGVTPERFPNYYVVTIDGDDVIRKYYDHPIVDKYGVKIKGFFSTVSSPLTVQRARDAKIKVYWMHSLLDYNEGKKSFNQISSLMVRAKNHTRGLPAIQTGGNVGTSSWFVSWKILKCSVVCLIGINHSWDSDDPDELIMSQFKNSQYLTRDSPQFNKLFSKVYNPEFGCDCILDPTFQYYSNGLKEFIRRSPLDIATINATEGGCIFGERIKCMKFDDFLKNYKT